MYHRIGLFGDFLSNLHNIHNEETNVLLEKENFYYFCEWKLL